MTQLQTLRNTCLHRQCI